MKNYITHKGIECLNSCLYNHIHGEGFYISHSDIFFLGQGLDITYTGHPEEKMIYSKQYESNYVFMDKYLPQYLMDSLCGESEQYLGKWLMEKTVKGNYVIIQVTSSRLPYNKVFSKKDIISHFINVLDYDADTGQFYISDGCPPVMTDDVYEGWIQEKELLENWESMGGKYIILDFDNNRLSDIQCIRQEAGRAFQKQLNTYIKGKSGFFKSRYKGCMSVITMFNDMIPLFENQVPDMGNVIMNVHRQLKINGFLQAKDYILDKARDLKITEDVCKKYENIIREWNGEMMRFIKIGLQVNTAEYIRFIKRVESLAGRELEVLQVLNKFS